MATEHSLNTSFIAETLHETGIADRHPPGSSTIRASRGATSFSENPRFAPSALCRFAHPGVPNRLVRDLGEDRVSYRPIEVQGCFGG